MISRRTFIQHSSFALAGMACMNSLLARAAATTGPLGLPIGIQLYTVREETAKDLNGTLQKLASYGYGEVELAGYYGKSAKELRAFLSGFGLRAPSTHQGLKDLLVDTQKKIDFAAELGVQNLVVPFPAVADNRFDKVPNDAPNSIVNGTTLDDWKWIADQLNKIGAMTKKAGIRIGYHNHNLEFRKIGNDMIFEKLIAWTDPELVTIELDLGWVVAAGLDPIAFTKKHSKRVSMLHVKDVKKGVKPLVDKVETDTTEIGSGQIDWKALFTSLDKSQIKHYFVEQENFDRPIMESVKISHDYLAKLKV
jgi:sugar phosphate isomerase/epimerase